MIVTPTYATAVYYGSLPNSPFPFHRGQRYKFILSPGTTQGSYTMDVVGKIILPFSHQGITKRTGNYQSIADLRADWAQWVDTDGKPLPEGWPEPAKLELPFPIDVYATYRRQDRNGPYYHQGRYKLRVGPAPFPNINGFLVESLEVIELNGHITPLSRYGWIYISKEDMQQDWAHWQDTHHVPLPDEWLSYLR